MLVFDIGANIGSWSLSNVNNYDKIIAIEASPITFQKLLNNVKHDKIVPLNYAVCNNNGNDIIFYQASNDVLSTINKNWLTNPESRFFNHPFMQITCKTITIDSLIKDFGIPDLIKIDVEGGEYECISSLTQKVKLLCFEWASELSSITLNCINYLTNLGYTEFYIQKGDDYTFIPSSDNFYDLNTLNKLLSNMINKIDWGMIWCR